MHSQHRHPRAALLLAAMITGCSERSVSPDDQLSLRNERIRGASVDVWTSDSSLAVGETATIGVRIIDLRTGRDLTGEVKPTVTVSGPALTLIGTEQVRGSASGSAWLVARFLSGSDSVRITVAAATAPPAPPPEVAPPTPPPGAPPEVVAPMLPAATVSTAMPTVLRTIRVAANDARALQAALDAAVAGDEIVLPAGSVYRGNFTLRRRTVATPTIIRSESVPVGPGVRITPGVAGGLATLETVTPEPALAALPGTQGWRLVGLRIQLAAGAADNYGILRLGSGTETTLADLPTNIVIDRSVITGGATGSSSRCIALNSASTAIIDSWISECHARFRDSQGIGGWNGSGPYLIENNRIEGSGQGIMFGGADPSITNLTPSDITIRRNHLFKPTSWAGRWTVKAAFELKHARRLLFEGNVIENHWSDAQAGYAILFQAVSQDGRAPWTRVWDVTVRHNVVRNSMSGVNVLSRFGTGSQMPTEPSRRIWFHNNLFREIGRDPITGATTGRYFQILGDLIDPAFTNNTAHGTGAGVVAIFDGAEQMTRLVMVRNVFGESLYGLIGSGFAEGTGSLVRYAPGAVVLGNVFTGRPESRYPGGNFFPGALGLDAFTAPAGGDWTLRSALPFASYAGQLVGVNSAVANAVIGNATRE